MEQEKRGAHKNKKQKTKNKKQKIEAIFAIYF